MAIFFNFLVFLLQVNQLTTVQLPKKVAVIPPEPRRKRKSSAESTECPTAKVAKKPSFLATFSLKNLVAQSFLKESEKLQSCQSFSLTSMRSVEAVAANEKAELKQSQSEASFYRCAQCDQKWLLTSENWPKIAQHITRIQSDNSGVFGKHLSKMLDQHLVLFQAKDGALSFTSVLKCRKCKFYIEHHSDLEGLAAHYEACFKTKPINSSAQRCDICASAQSADDLHSCLDHLSKSLLLQCKSKDAEDQDCLLCYPHNNNNNNTKAVISTTNCKQNQISQEQRNLCEKHCNNNNNSKSAKFISKMATCLSEISRVFESGESIDEHIVASKQRLKKM